jgi:hypothetical protein
MRKPTCLALVVVTTSCGGAVSAGPRAGSKLGARPHEWSTAMRIKATLALVFVMATAAAGCRSSNSANSTSARSHAPVASSPTGTPAARLVGRWERVITCQELVGNLDKAGLGPLAPYAWMGQTSSTGQSSFAPGSPKPTRAHPCTGAVRRTHSHFFNQSGQFGSLDWLGGQVDDDQYRIIDGDTVSIGKVTFQYRITNGNTLTLSPLLTTAMIRQALADPREFSDAGWAVSVAYAGYSWKRVPCQSWC